MRVGGVREEVRVGGGEWEMGNQSGFNIPSPHSILNSASGLSVAVSSALRTETVPYLLWHKYSCMSPKVYPYISGS